MANALWPRVRGVDGTRTRSRGVNGTRPRFDAQVQNLRAADAEAAAPKHYAVRFASLREAVSHVYAAHGVSGFFRGAGVRAAMMGPACAVSWTTYEGCKRLYERKWAR